MDDALQLGPEGISCRVFAVKESFPRPRKSAGVAKRESEAAAEIDGDIAIARARLEELLGRAVNPEAILQEAERTERTDKGDKSDFRARRFRPKGDLPESGEAPDPGQREIAAPPPRESIPAEFRASAPGTEAAADGEPKPAPYWADPEGEAARPLRDARVDLRRIPAGLWFTFIVAALGAGIGLGYVLRGETPAAGNAESSAPVVRVTPTPLPKPVASAPIAGAPPRTGLLVQLERLPRDFASSPGMAKFNEAVAAESEGKFDVAIRLLKEAGEMKPRPPGVALRLGFVSARRGDLASATEYFKQAVATGEGAAAAAMQLAMMHADIKSWEAVEEWMQVAIALEPLRARNYLFWGDIARRQGHPGQALLRYQLAQKRELDPAEFSVLRVRIAVTELERGNAAEIERFLNEAGEEQRKVPDWPMMMAAVELQRGQMEKAAEYLRAARAGYPLPLAAMQARDLFFTEYQARPVVGSILRDMVAGTPKEGSN